MKKLTILILLVMLAALGAGAGYAQTPQAEWTIMMYGAMDNDLEPYLFVDIHQMQLVGSTPDVNLVVQFDRTQGYETRWGNWTDTRRFYLTRKDAPDYTPQQQLEVAADFFATQMGVAYDEAYAELQLMQQTDLAAFDRLYRRYRLDISFDLDPVQILGEIDMSDPRSLEDFVTWAITEYPAKRYMLVISSHGAGWAGIGPDYDSGRTIILTPDIEAGIAAALQNTGVEKLDIIGFDACLMAQYEVATDLQSVARYLLAAEEVIPGFGWEYTAPLSVLVANPKMDAETFGRTIIDAYIEDYAAQNRSRVDLHLLDLSQVDQLTAALAQFDRVISADLVNRLDMLAAARHTSQSFGLDPLAGDAMYSFIDIKDFMRRVFIQSFDQPEIAAAAQNVIEAVDNMVVYSRADDSLPGANGISFYFPLNESDYALLGAERGYELASSGARQWNGFLTQVHQTINTRIRPDSLRVTLTDAPQSASIYDPAAIYFGYDGVGIAGIRAIVSLELNSGQRVMISEAPIARMTSVSYQGEFYDYVDYSPRPSNFFVWDSRMTILTDDVQSVPVLLRPKGFDEGIINGVVFDINGDFVSEVLLIYNIAQQRITSMYGFTAEGFPFQMQTFPGDSLVPIWQTIGPEGQLDWELGSATFDITFGLPEIAFVPALDGMYHVGIEIQDLAGNIAFDGRRINVFNSNLDADWMAFKSPSDGVTFLYPSHWVGPEALLREDGSFAVTVFDVEDALTFITVITYDGGDYEGRIARSRENAAQLDGVTFFNDIELTIGDNELRGFDLEFDAGDQRLSSVRLFYNVSANDRVYLVAMVIPKTREDYGLEVLLHLLETITFFAPR